jgi:hypothetical protein
MGLIDSVDTLILGANTYAQAKDYWPYADEQGEYGEKLNNLTKFVASSKLDDAPGATFPPRPRPATGRHHPRAQGAELKGHLVEKARARRRVRAPGEVCRCWR